MNVTLDFQANFLSWQIVQKVKKRILPVLDGGGKNTVHFIALKKLVGWSLKNIQKRAIFSKRKRKELVLPNCRLSS